MPSCSLQADTQAFPAALEVEPPANLSRDVAFKAQHVHRTNGPAKIMVFCGDGVFHAWLSGFVSLRGLLKRGCGKLLL